MKLLTLCFITCNSLEPLKKMLASVSSYVDDYIVGIDCKTNDGTSEYLASLGITNAYFFELTSFSRARNEGISRVSTPWILVLDSDEIMLEKHASRLREYCLRGDILKVDSWLLHRNHFFDLEMTKYYHPPASEDHIRLFRNSSIRYEGRVHESPQGYSSMRKCDLEIEHFNMFYRDNVAWDKTNRLYNSLMHPE